MGNLVVKKSYGAPQKQILIANELAFTIGARVDNTGVEADSNGRKILKAGTPLFGDLLDRDTAFVKATEVEGTKGTWTVTIDTAFAADEKIIIAGTTYTCKAEENVDNKQFAGNSAAEQAASLKKMIAADGYVVTVASAVLTFTQSVADAADQGPAVSKEATTGAFTKASGTSPVDGSSNANVVILHDVDVTEGEENATIVVFGFIDKKKLDDDVKALISGATIKSLSKITFLNGSLM